MRVLRKLCTVCGAVFYTRSPNRKYCKDHSASIRTTGIGRSDDYSEDYIPPEEGEPQQ